METQTLQVTIETWQAVLGVVGFIFIIGVSWGTLWTKIDHVSDGLKGLKDNFDGYLRDLALKAASGEGRQGSPLMPTEDGTRLLTESGARVLIEQQTFKDWFFPLVDKRNPENGFEVERAVFSTLLQTKEDDRWDPMKQYVFTHPIYNGSPLTLERLFIVISWILRDEYMASRHLAVA